MNLFENFEIEKATGTIPKSRGRRSANKSPGTISPAAGLIEALEFIAHSQKKAGNTKDRFCRIENGIVRASNGIISMSHPIAEMNLTCTPATIEFLKALQQAKSDLAITAQEHSIVVTSGDSRVVVHTMPGWLPPEAEPDAPQGQADSRLCEALDAVSAVLCPPSNSPGANLLHSMALIKDQTCVATDGQTLLEYWHGIHIPVKLLIPLTAIKPLQKKRLLEIGTGPASLTFHFEGGAWLKTALWDGQFPDYAQAFQLENPFYQEIPEHFKQTVKTVASFGPEAMLTICGQEFGAIGNEQSTFRVPGLQAVMKFKAARLKDILDGFKNVHFDAQSDRVFFYNGNLRGITFTDLERPANIPAEGSYTEQMFERLDL